MSLASISSPPTATSSDTISNVEKTVAVSTEKIPPLKSIPLLPMVVKFRSSANRPEAVAAAVIGPDPLPATLPLFAGWFELFAENAGP